MIALYNQIIYYPLLNLLVFLYNVIPGHDIGVVIILLTALIRLALAPSFQKSLKSQAIMSNLQPKLNELRERYKGDKEGMAKATMELYKEHKINPLSSCLPLLVQLPILIALYQVFNEALSAKADIALRLTGLYNFVQRPEFINPNLFGILDLSRPNLILGVLAGLSQFWQSKMMLSQNTQSTDPTAKIMAVQTTYVLPIISIVIAAKLPAGLPLYWIVTTVFSIAQQYYVMRKPKASG